MNNQNEIMKIELKTFENNWKSYVKEANNLKLKKANNLRIELKTENKILKQHLYNKEKSIKSLIIQMMELQEDLRDELRRNTELEEIIQNSSK